MYQRLLLAASIILATSLPSVLLAQLNALSEQIAPIMPYHSTFEKLKITIFPDGVKTIEGAVLIPGPDSVKTIRSAAEPPTKCGDIRVECIGRACTIAGPVPIPFDPFSGSIDIGTGLVNAVIKEGKTVSLKGEVGIPIVSGERYKYRFGKKACIFRSQSTQSLAWSDIKVSVE